MGVPTPLKGIAHEQKESPHPHQFRRVRSRSTHRATCHRRPSGGSRHQFKHVKLLCIREYIALTKCKHHESRERRRTRSDRILPRRLMWEAQIAQTCYNGGNDERIT